jgi:hypothetical protein
VVCSILHTQDGNSHKKKQPKIPRQFAEVTPSLLGAGGDQDERFAGKRAGELLASHLKPADQPYEGDPEAHATTERPHVIQAHRAVSREFPGRIQEP